jgi:hypothetical protein
LFTAFLFSNDRNYDCDFTIRCQRCNSSFNNIRAITYAGMTTPHLDRSPAAGAIWAQKYIAGTQAAAGWCNGLCCLRKLHFSARFLGITTFYVPGPGATARQGAAELPSWSPLANLSDGVMRLSASQLATLVDGMDWSRLYARDVAQPTATS